MVLQLALKRKFQTNVHDDFQLDILSDNLQTYISLLLKYC